MRRAAAAHSDDSFWLPAWLAVSLSAILLAAVAPEHALRILVVLAVLPALVSLTVPPLRELGRRIEAGWGGESLAFVLEAAALERVMAALLALHVAGMAAVIAMLLARQPGDGWLAWSAVAPLGVAAALAGLLALVASVKPNACAPVTAMPWLLAAAGIGFIAGAGLDARLAGPLALAAMLGPAQALPAVMAVLWLPWLHGTAVVMGAVGGATVGLALGFFRDPGTAALAGLCTNLLVATLTSIARPGPDLESRTRLQRALPATWPAGLRPLFGAVAMLWLFLVLGPGWSLTREVVGGDGPGSLIGAASGVAGWLWLRGQKRTSQSTRP